MMIILNNRPSHILSLLVGLALVAALWASPLAAYNNDDFLNLCAESGLPGQADAIKKAIDEGADVNYAGPEGLTPLMVFVAGHNDADWQAVASVRALLKAGAQVNAKSREGGTALSYAVLHKAGPRIISTLIQHGAEVNLGVSGRGGLTPLMLAASQEPEPIISALLLAAGADPRATATKDGQPVSLGELAAQNPNPKVRRFIDAAVARGPVPTGGLPLFADLPADQELHLAIIELDKGIRARIGADNWLAWLAYIRWQTEIEASVELRQKDFGNRPAEAWRNEYAFYLESLSENGGRAALAAVDQAAEGGRLMIQGGWSGERGLVSDLIALADRKMVLMRRPGRGALVAYETDSGRELWRYTPSALSDFHLLDGAPGGAAPLILVASHWGQQFGDAAVLDPVSGRVLLELPPLDSPKWTLDQDRKILAISTDYSLHILNLAERKNTHQSWYDLLESRPWEEARALAREHQNALLAPYKLGLNDEGLFLRNNFHLFQGRREADPEMLREARQALSTHNYRQLAVLALDPRSRRDHSFVLGPACTDNCGPQDLATPLFLVNKRLNRIDCLMVDNDPERILTRSALGWAKGDGEGLRPLISFSPSGAVLALAEGSGEIHFFAVADGGRHLGSLSGETVLDQTAGLKVKDARLLALLDDDLSGRPFLAFSFPDGRNASGLMAEVDLAADQVLKTFNPRPGQAQGLTAFAAAGDDQWAVGLENGALWRLNPAVGAPVRVNVPEGRQWTALAFSGDGRRLAAADRDGGLHLIEGDRVTAKVKLDLKNIRHLALDGEGRYAWAAADIFTQNQRPQPALALVDLSGAQKPIYRPARGRILSLEFRPEAGYAAAVEDLPPSAAPADPEMKAMEVVRWAPGRTDIVQFDHLRPQADGRTGRYDLEKSFVGISPDFSAVLYQELKPSQAFVNLGRETTAADRDSAELESFTYQAWLGQAVFSQRGQRRLALLPERGRVGNDDGAWPFQAGGAFYIYDLASGREISYMSDRTKHPGGILGAAFGREPGRALTAGRDGALRLWDLGGARPENLLTWVFLDNGNWVVLDRDGRFDSPDPDGLNGLHWTVSGRTVPLEAFIQDFYQPRLAAYVAAGQELPALTPVQARDLSQPRVKITGISPEKEFPGRVAVTVEIDGRAEGLNDYQISQLKLFRDGRLVAHGPAPGDTPLKLTEGRAQTTFRRVALPRGRDQVLFSASVFNQDRVRARSARAAIKYKLNNTGESRLHLVTMGVGSFDNPAWNLDSAAADAQSFAATLPRFFAGTKAEVRSLAGGQGQPKPTKANLRATLGSLAPDFSSGSAAGGSGPDDLIVLTISSRGLTAEGQFRVLPADISGQDQSLSPEFLDQTISMEDLAAWLAPLDAAEIALIIDARRPDSASATAAFEPGPMGDRTLGLLAYDKGIRLLCTVSDGRDVVDFNQERRGLLSHTLLTGGLEMSQAAPQPGRNFSLRDWLSFGLAQTSRLYSAPSAAAEARPEKAAELPPLIVNPVPRLFDFGGVSQPWLRAGSL